METAAAFTCAAALWPTKVALAFNDRRSSREIHEILCQESHEGPLQPLGGGEGALWAAPGTIVISDAEGGRSGQPERPDFWLELTQPTLLQGKLSNLVCNNNKIPDIEFQGIPPSPPPISPPTAALGPLPRPFCGCFEFSYGAPDPKTAPGRLPSGRTFAINK